MNPLTLFAYYTTQRDSILENLPAIKEAENRALHQFRVAVKKLRAYSVFIGDITDGDFELMKQLQLLETVFKKAGKIRDAQVQQELLAGYENTLATTFDAFGGFLIQLEQKHATPFPDSLQRLDAAMFNKADAILLSHLERVQWDGFIEKLKDITQQKVYRLGIFKVHRGDEERLHDFRKLFKELMYTYRFCKGFAPDFVPQLSPQRMDVFAERIGEWHDQTVMLEMIRKFEKSTSEKSTKKLKKAVSDRSILFMETFENQLLEAKLVI